MFIAQYIRVYYEKNKYGKFWGIEKILILDSGWSQIIYLKKYEYQKRGIGPERRYQTMYKDVEACICEKEQVIAEGGHTSAQAVCCGVCRKNKKFTRKGWQVWEIKKK